MSARSGRLSTPTPLSPEELEAFIDLGCMLAAELADETFKRATAGANWSLVNVDAAVDQALDRMDQAAQDMLIVHGHDPDCSQWAELWAAMELRYRERIAEQLKSAGPRGGGTVQ